MTTTGSSSVKQESPMHEPLINQDQSGQTKNISKLLFVSFSTLLNFTGFNGAQSILTKIYEQMRYVNLGRYCFATLYLCFTLANVVAPKIVQSLGIKSCLIISTFGYFMSLAAVFNAITGLSAGVIWNSYLKYVSNVTSENNKGKYFGIYHSFQSSSTLTGNLLTIIIFNYTDKFYFFFIQSLFCLASFIMLWFLPSDGKSNKEVLSRSQLSEQSENPQQLTLKQNIDKIIVLGKKKSIRPLFYMFFLKGIVISFYNGFLFKVVDVSRPEESQEQRTKYLGLVMTMQGLASIASGNFAGKLFDMVRRQRIIALACFFVQCSLLITLIAYFQRSYALCFVASAFWGLSTCSLGTINSSLISQDYKGAPEGFALQLFQTNLGTFVGFFLQIILNGYHPYYFMFVAIFIQAYTTSQAVLYQTKSKYYKHKEDRQIEISI